MGQPETAQTGRAAQGLQITSGILEYFLHNFIYFTIFDIHVSIILILKALSSSYPQICWTSWYSDIAMLRFKTIIYPGGLGLFPGGLGLSRALFFFTKKMFLVWPNSPIYPPPVTVLSCLLCAYIYSFLARLNTKISWDISCALLIIKVRKELVLFCLHQLLSICRKSSWCVLRH
jgi:hypothetical protein